MRKLSSFSRCPLCSRTPSGQAVSDLGLAVNERFQDRDGKAVDRPCFVDIVAWGRLAEACGKHLEKGAPVAIEGRLRFEQWQTPQGERRNRLRVLAHRIQFLGRPARAEAGAAAPEGAAEAAPAKGGVEAEAVPAGASGGTFAPDGDWPF